MFQLVIMFILLLTGYICLSINHSKAFNVKNMIVKEVERQEGVDLANPGSDEAVKNIVSYLQKVSYRTTGKCPDGYTGFNRDGAISSTNSAFCIAEQVARTSTIELPTMSYYRVVVFYQLDLPIFRSMFEFQVTGDTKIISHIVEMTNPTK